MEKHAPPFPFTKENSLSIAKILSPDLTAIEMIF